MRKVLGILIVAVLVSAGVAAASSLSVSGGRDQQGADADLKCDEGGVLVQYTLSGTNITGAVVSNIDNDCFGAQMTVTWSVQSASDRILQVTSLTTNQYTKTFTPPIPLGSLIGVNVIISGHDSEPPNKDCPC